MLYYLSEYFSEFWGPLRLLRSHALLAAGATALSAILIAVLLPKLWNTLPRDRGKAICGPDGMKSAGKPTGAGFLVTLLTLPAIIIFAPLGIWDLAAVVTFYLAMIFGYLDDRAVVPWGEFKKGLLDLAVSFALAFFIAKGHSTIVWLPFYKGMWEVPFWLYVSGATVLLWVTINATNCSDGVDGLAGTLTEISLIMLAVIMYVVIGYKPVAHYFLLPCNPASARWAILVMAVAGGFGGYLWFNAEPSKILMGDAGSRFLGILVGAAVLVCGNPFLIFALSPIVLVNGGAGLLKILFLRCAKKLGCEVSNTSVINRIRFPLHDHCKKNLGWSNAQVLMRFTLLQLVIMPIVLLIIFKVR